MIVIYNLHRVPVSMGAVGASAPTVFESVGASTHGFWQISHICFNFHRNDAENITKLVIP